MFATEKKTITKLMRYYISLAEGEFAFAYSSKENFNRVKEAVRWTCFSTEMFVITLANTYKLTTEAEKDITEFIHKEEEATIEIIERLKAIRFQ